jgi:hypothetical protein
LLQAAVAIIFTTWPAHGRVWSNPSHRRSGPTAMDGGSAGVAGIAGAFSSSSKRHGAMKSLRYNAHL